MPISFANIPANIKVPLYWVEVDPSMAGIPTINLRALLVGTKIAAGKQPQDIAVPIGSQAQADLAFGQGSELGRMFKAFFANNFANEVWGLPMAEAGGSAAATGTITVTAAPTAAGTVSLYISGELVPVNISTTDTPTTIAAAIVTGITNNTTLPVTATNALGVVTITSKFKSVNANDISVQLNYYGTMGGETTPPGLGMTLPATGFLTGGVGTPLFTNAISNLGETPFEYVAMPYTDSPSLVAWDQEFGFTDTGRWGWMRELFGHVITARRGTYAALLAWGDTQNSGVISAMGFETASPTPVYEWAAAYCAKTQRAFINDPARPLQALTLNQIKAAPLNLRFRFNELNSLALNGVAIQKIGGDNQPMIAREQTQYQLNIYGQPDDAYELMTTLATLAKLLRNQKHAITSKFPRHKLANDGTKFGPGQAIVTPGIIKAELINQYQQDMYNGLVEDLSNFKRNLIVERDPNDPNRVNVLYPPDLINQLRVFAVLAQFRLQYDRGVDQQIIGQPQPPFNAASGNP